jgi:hypothetical protein
MDAAAAAFSTLSALAVFASTVHHGRASCPISTFFPPRLTTDVCV